MIQAMALIFQQVRRRCQTSNALAFAVVPGQRLPLTTGPMLNYVFRRILLFVPILIGLVTVLFALLNILPGDPARLMAGPFADPDTVETIRHQMGFDRPLLVQYLDNLWKLARGEFGRSYQSRRPILGDLIIVFPKTVQLAVTAELTSALLGIWLGVVAAARRNGWADRLVMAVAALNLSFPLFWLALMLQIVFAVFLRVLPPSGYGAGFDRFVILPAITLALPSMGLLARITRAALIEVMGEDYIRTARAKGLRRALVMRRHILPNALIPIVTTIGNDFVHLLGGIPIIEVIFAWPGIGKYAFDALVFRDLPALQASVMILAISVSLVNLAVDLLYAFINPRIRYV